jgi:hypothetical protein
MRKVIRSTVNYVKDCLRVTKMNDTCYSNLVELLIIIESLLKQPYFELHVWDVIDAHLFVKYTISRLSCLLPRQYLM